LDPATTEVNDKKFFLIGQTTTKDAARPQGRQTHNQPQKKQEKHNLARVRAVTLRTACWVCPPAIECIWLLLLLLPHKKEGGKEVRRQGGDKRIRTPSHLETLLSPAADAPRKQEIPQGCCDVRLLSSSAASCFREGGLVQKEQRSAWLSKQVRARWLPKTVRGGPTVAIVLP
jgi:hypothetical protein